MTTTLTKFIKPTAQVNTARIEVLIEKAIERGAKDFDDIFLYVGRNSYNAPERFYFAVENVFKSMKRRGLVKFDRKASAWFLVETEA